MCRINIFLVLLAICTGTGYSQTIQVDARNVIKVFNHHPVGINVNYLMDDDAYLKPEIPIAQALISMKVGMLRYPGGEKSDNYLWSIPPPMNPQILILLPGVIVTGQTEITDFLRMQSIRRLTLLILMSSWSYVKRSGLNP